MPIESVYHQPVLLAESVEALQVRPDGVYADLTFGGGGHSRAILEQLDGGRLFGFDQDEAAVANVPPDWKARGFTLIEGNFRYLQRYLRLYNISQVDGILADLGVSSHQFDTPERGFSTRFEADLDMRMDRRTVRTAKDLLNDFSEKDLHRILGMYGEVRNARTLAAELVRVRAEHPFQTVDDLKGVLRRLAPRGKEHKYYAQVFQALRIELNDEMAALREMLTQAAAMLKPGGRLVVISYHSLEDRLVKRFISTGKFEGEAEKDLYGNVQAPLRAVTRRPIEPEADEVARNPRARSAKLRVGEKV
ncbi:16S rRNA (cytosine1402-N4)-methyltransferase [Catalinimonas alkaloidigena]|uniref:Ribosomal RNA small subunit methyltransferase H n=1 Tax=Catalinimonas alkaloidigena TaxID=1075417 RepID=A0A1G9JBP5_9BACT|nr:16S rRNA (cytosine(1402)-N(4))-methyltransferase RsmH [Catalinimonas alkaloidigena]SDL34554.1 16S rRNA (cytosine1402-N4)-methyltransferase [Catalinimonas alkaloidigena]